jgi:hypothetical protein
MLMVVLQSRCLCCSAQPLLQLLQACAAIAFRFGADFRWHSTAAKTWPGLWPQVQVIFKIASSSEVPSIPETLSPLASEFILLCLQVGGSGLGVWSRGP